MHLCGGGQQRQLARDLDDHVLARDPRQIAQEAAFVIDMLEHVEDERGFLRELARVARKYVVVEVPCELTLQTTTGKIQSNLTALGHINSFTPHSFALTLATSGLEVADLQVFDHSEAIQIFRSSPLKGKLKRAIRTGLLKLHPGLAAKIFYYHCGALCDVRAAGGV